MIATSVACSPVFVRLHAEEEKARQDMVRAEASYLLTRARWQDAVYRLADLARKTIISEIIDTAIGRGAA